MLRAYGLFILAFATIFSWPSFAGSFDYIPADSGAAKEFKSLANGGSYREALIAWSSAFGGTEFARSQDGTATYAYLLYQNGLPFIALENLVQETQPNKLNPQLLALWSTEMKSSLYMQKGWILSIGAWKKIVDNTPVNLRLSSRGAIWKAFRMADRLPKDQVNAKARIWWQIANQAPLINRVDDSLKALKLLKESGQTVIGHDLISSTLGRVLYQKGEIDASVAAYNEIPKSSNIWVESLEERTWAAVRKSDYDKALGQLTTLLSPALVPIVGPETYFLANLMNLKTCDYVRLFKTSDLFKKRYSERLADMEALSKTGTNKNINDLMGRLESGGVNIAAAGPLVTSIPRSAYRDAKFVRAVESRRELLKESQNAADLKGATNALGGGSSLENLSQSARLQADRLKQLAFVRARQLATNELKEYRTVINKMHIVEAEVIERVHMDDNLKGKRSPAPAVAVKDDDTLIFPYKSDEVWFDELDHYKAQVKDCPTLKMLKGASL